MRLKTEQFTKEVWRWLCRQEHRWDYFGNFAEWMETQPEVDAGAINTYLTKIEPDEPWGPDNARIVNVHEEWMYDRVLAGAYPFKQEIEE